MVGFAALVGLSPSVAVNELGLWPYYITSVSSEIRLSRSASASEGSRSLPPFLFFCCPPFSNHTRV